MHACMCSLQTAGFSAEYEVESRRVGALGIGTALALAGTSQGRPALQVAGAEQVMSWGHATVDWSAQQQRLVQACRREPLGPPERGCDLSPCRRRDWTVCLCILLQVSFQHAMRGQVRMELASDASAQCKDQEAQRLLGDRWYTRRSMSMPDTKTDALPDCLSPTRSMLPKKLQSSLGCLHNTATVVTSHSNSDADLSQAEAKPLARQHDGSHRCGLPPCKRHGGASASAQIGPSPGEGSPLVLALRQQTWLGQGHFRRHAQRVLCRLVQG